jgi:hypothetical protein
MIGNWVWNECGTSLRRTRDLAMLGLSGIWTLLFRFAEIVLLIIPNPKSLIDCIAWFR